LSLTGARVWHGMRAPASQVCTWTSARRSTGST
jgi:hypothetical protein